MLNNKRSEKMKTCQGPKRGTAEARDDFVTDDYGYIKKGQVGIVTAYLPEENKFCVFWGESMGFTTYNCTEEEFDRYFKLSSMDEVLIV